MISIIKMKNQIINLNNAYSPEYKYLIKWNAKCGCTLLRRFFLHLHKNEKKIIDKEWENGLPSFRYDIKLKPEIINTFLLVRNPYKRVVSMFTNKYIGKLTNDSLRHKFNINENSFYMFVLKLKEIKETNKWCDIHITPQYFNHQKTDILIKLENIKPRIIDLYSTISRLEPLKSQVYQFFDGDLGYINASNKKNLNEFIGYKIFSIDDNMWPDYKYFYDEKIKKLVYEIYKEDFELFNYKYDSI